jgi:hypothetical protein
VEEDEGEESGGEESIDVPVLLLPGAALPAPPNSSAEADPTDEEDEKEEA